ncbi:MAG: amidohydrolase [Deltaproteobacteria bacterium]|nr:amidohydrolase [Deltaproteobacteria bacterium]
MDLVAVKRFVTDWVEQNKDEFADCAMYLRDNPELAMQEFRAFAYITSLCEKHGFRVEKGVAGIPTAFVATWGGGKPVVAYSVEYDALPGLSQTVSTRKEPVVEGGPGHGCGHCLLGAGAVQAGVAQRYAMEKFGLSGTVRILGTPAEEICIGKPFMARAGLFDDIDVFLDWHPFINHTFVSRSANAYFNKYYHFSGKTAHGNSPWNGRSSLDAAMLMGHAVEMLREHIKPGTEAAANTINYTFSNVGPEFPSVVPDKTTAWYVGRFNTTEIMTDVMERIDNCAKGAALATGTTVEAELVTAIHEKIPNEVLGRLIHRNFEEIGLMDVTPEEDRIMKEMQTSAGSEPVGISREIVPPSTLDAPVCDTSEYSWFAPMGSFWPAVMPGPALHHWVITASTGTSVGRRAVGYAAKVLANSAVELLLKPEIVAEAWKEQEERMAGRKFASLIPDHIQPPLDANKATMEKYR